MRIEWKPLRSPFNFSNRFDGGTRKSSNRLAALIASSLRFARGACFGTRVQPHPKTVSRSACRRTIGSFCIIYRIPVYEHPSLPSWCLLSLETLPLGSRSVCADLLIRAAFIPAAAFLASPPEIERPPPFVVIGEPDAGGALSAASFAAESIGFVLQKNAAGSHRFCFGGFRRRTPGPPPFSSMNSTVTRGILQPTD